MCQSWTACSYDNEIIDGEIIDALVPVVQRPRTPPFQGGNTGSNPVRDAIPFSRRSGAGNCMKAKQVTPVPTSFPSNVSPSGKIARWII